MGVHHGSEVLDILGPGRYRPLKLSIAGSVRMPAILGTVPLEPASTACGSFQASTIDSARSPGQLPR